LIRIREEPSYLLVFGTFFARSTKKVVKIYGEAGVSYVNVLGCSKIVTQVLLKCVPRRNRDTFELPTSVTSKRRAIDFRLAVLPEALVTIIYNAGVSRVVYGVIECTRITGDKGISRADYRISPRRKRERRLVVGFVVIAPIKEQRVNVFCMACGTGTAYGELRFKAKERYNK
jgi:hypothetical protein